MSARGDYDSDARTRREPGEPPPAAPAPEEQPFRVGRYTVLRCLGRGGMGVVYAAYDDVLDRKIALKLVHVARDRGTVGQARLLREAQALARLSHPNVVQVYEVGEHERQVFLAMEFVAGAPLLDRSRTARRPWREVLGVYLQAGRGLAAAHAVGLVHRDFKPDNAILAEDGRVRVLDFGLARAVVGEVDDRVADAPTLRERDAALDSQDLSQQLTVVGQLVGTPAYMSPEQLLCRPIDARSDQYSFCVALWETLYGARPFAAHSVDELKRNQFAGPPRPPRGPVPAWLGRSLVRGLSVDPEQRYPDMNALLVALADDPGQRRRRRAIALAAGALLAGGGAAGYALLAREGVAACAAHDPLAGVWDPVVRDAVAARFSALDLPFADRSFDQAAAGLDAYAARLRDRFRDACEAQRRGLRSGRALELQVDCGERLRGELAAVVEVLRHADARAVEYAGQAVAQLPATEACGELGGLLAADDRSPALEDPAKLAHLRAEAPRLAAARAEYEAGHHERSREFAREVVLAGERLDHPPLLAEALLLLGKADLAAADSTSAGTHLLRSYTVAESARQDRLALDASIRLVALHGKHRHELAAAQAWVAVAQAKLDRIGDDPRLRIHLLLNTASALIDADQREESELRLREALALAERRQDEDPGLYIDVINALARLALESRRPLEAEPLLRRSQALSEALFGPAHPRVGVVLHNLGIVLLQRRDYARSAAMFQRALEIRERGLGGEHPASLETLNGLGTALREGGDRMAGLAIYRRILAVEELRRGPDDLDLFTPINNLGFALLDAGDLEAAAAHFTRAQALLERHDRTASNEYHLTLSNLATLALERADPAGAVALFERALVLGERLYGPDAIDVGATLAFLAHAELAIGRTGAAEAHVTRALAFPDLVDNPVELAHARVVQATLLGRDPATRAEALELARKVAATEFPSGAPRAETRRLIAEARRLIADLSRGTAQER